MAFWLVLFALNACSTMVNILTATEFGSRESAALAVATGAIAAFCLFAALHAEDRA